VHGSAEDTGLLRRFLDAVDRRLVEGDSDVQRECTKILGSCSASMPNLLCRCADSCVVAKRADQVGALKSILNPRVEGSIRGEVHARSGRLQALADDEAERGSTDGSTDLPIPSIPACKG
jgi:hypothetical protein